MATQNIVSAQMARVAIDRLDMTKELLAMLYIDNQNTPESLRVVVKDYVDGKISREVAGDRINKLADLTIGWRRLGGGEK